MQLLEQDERLLGVEHLAETQIVLFMSMALEEIYQVELLNRDGTILGVHEQKTPIRRYQFGAEIEVPGAQQRKYIVTENYSSPEDEFPHRQTLVVELMTD